LWHDYVFETDVLSVEVVVVIRQLLLNKVPQGIDVVLEHVRLGVGVKLSDEEDKSKEVYGMLNAIVGVILL
jgi:hypothetical protein